jgi:hypothetical protein
MKEKIITFKRGEDVAECVSEGVKSVQDIHPASQVSLFMCGVPMKKCVTPR